MNAKKSPQKNLENKKVLFFKTGLVLTLTFVLVAFQYRVTDRAAIIISGVNELMVETEMIEITIPKPPEPPAPETHDFQTVPDDEEIDEIDVFVDIDAHAELKLPDYTPSLGNAPEKLVEDEIIVRAEFDPEFPGGTKALFEYFSNTLRYPRRAQANNIQGTVFVGFVVEKDGSVSNVHIMRGIGGGCDEEALRAVNNMPRWSPGRMGTQPVRVQFSVPVVFRLH